MLGNRASQTSEKRQIELSRHVSSFLCVLLYLSNCPVAHPFLQTGRKVLGSGLHRGRIDTVAADPLVSRPVLSDLDDHASKGVVTPNFFHRLGCVSPPPSGTHRSHTPSNLYFLLPIGVFSMYFWV